MNNTGIHLLNLVNRRAQAITETMLRVLNGEIMDSQQIREMMALDAERIADYARSLQAELLDENE